MGGQTDYTCHDAEEHRISKTFCISKTATKKVENGRRPKSGKSSLDNFHLVIDMDTEKIISSNLFSSLQRLGANGYSIKFLAKVINSHIDRACRNLNYLEDTLGEIKPIIESGKIGRYEEFILANMLKKVVCSTDLSRIHQNEERSAEFAATELSLLGIPKSSIERVYGLILSTKPGRIPSNREERYMVDVDGAIFGKSPAVFARSEDALMQEHKDIPPRVYLQLRMNFLKSAPAMLYFTPEFQMQEPQAHENIEHRIAEISRVLK